MSEISILNGYKIKDKKAVRYYDTISNMKSDTTLKAGMYVKTKGYYSINDGGSAEYYIRTKTNEDIEDNKIIYFIGNLVAELITEKDINIKQLGAYGNDVNDDTEIIQYAINNFNSIYIPSGIYKITDEINIKANINLHGDGQNSILKSYFTYIDNIKYILKSDSLSTSITRSIIEKLKFINNEVNTLSGGIYIEFSTRGLVLNDLWFDSISNSIKLGDKIWSIASLTNIFSLYLPNNLSSELEDLAYGIYCEGNTIYGNNIEVIGCNKYGLYLNNCEVGSWKNLNISGSSSEYLMKNAILIENSRDIEINTGWFEQLDDGDAKLSKTINVLNSNQITLNTMHIASGNLFVNGSKNVKIYNSNYYSSSTGLRYMNNSKITCDKVSLGYCNYQSNEEYIMGTIKVIDFENLSNNNIYNNPLYFNGIQEDIGVSNGNSVTKTSNTTDQLTGDRCFNFNTNNYNGGQINTSNIVELDKVYTVLAYVKINSENVDKIYMLNTGFSTLTTYPNEYYKNVDNNTDYHLIRYTGKVTNETNNIKIVAKTKDGTTCDFIIDSVFIVEGEHDNNIPSPITKYGIMKNSKLSATVVPWTGTWSKGDIVYNNFNSSSNDNIIYWIYNGTNWTAKTIS